MERIWLGRKREADCEMVCSSLSQEWGLQEHDETHGVKNSQSHLSCRNVTLSFWQIKDLLFMVLIGYGLKAHWWKERVSQGAHRVYSAPSWAAWEGVRKEFVQQADENGTKGRCDVYMQTWAWMAGNLPVHSSSPQKTGLTSKWGINREPTRGKVWESSSYEEIWLFTRKPTLLGWKQGERSSGEGRGDIPESDAGSPGSLWPGWAALCLLAGSHLEQRCWSLSTSLPRGFLKPKQTPQLSAFAILCWIACFPITDFSEFFMYSDYKGISDMWFAIIFPRVWSVSSLSSL